MSDPYLDPQSGILLTNSALPTGHCSTSQAKSHHYLFQDVFEWAGQFRKIGMVKAEFASGGRVMRFTPPELIEQELTAVFQRPAQDRFLKGLSRRDFARKVPLLFS
jgi:fido (protein-threonine AMPylation protein)